SVGILFGDFQGLATNGVGDPPPGPPNAGASEQPELTTSRLLPQMLQQPARILAHQPLLLGHRHRLIVAGPDRLCSRESNASLSCRQCRAVLASKTKGTIF